MSAAFNIEFWSSQAALRPHQLACVLLGIEPTTDPRGISPDGAEPRLPASACHLGVNEQDWSNDYRLIKRTLESAIVAKELTATYGMVKTTDALVYLQKIAQEQSWEHKLACSEFFVRSTPKRTPILTDLARYPHENARLKLLLLAADEYYFNSEQVPVIDEVVDFIMRSSKGTKPAVTKTVATAIARLLNPDHCQSGGRPKKK